MEKDSVSEDWNEQRILRAGIEGMELRAAGRSELFLSSRIKAIKSTLPSRPSGPVPAVSLEGARLFLGLKIGMRQQADSLTPTGGRGQRSHKPRKILQRPKEGSA